MYWRFLILAAWCVAVHVWCWECVAPKSITSHPSHCIAKILGLGSCIALTCMIVVSSDMLWAALITSGVWSGVYYYYYSPFSKVSVVLSSILKKGSDFLGVTWTVSTSVSSHDSRHSEWIFYLASLIRGAWVSTQLALEDFSPFHAWLYLSARDEIHCLWIASHQTGVCVCVQHGVKIL